MPFEDIQVDYPTAYDDASTILGRPENRQVYILDGGLSVSSTTLTVDSGGLYDLEDLELPCLLLFEGGEIWYIEDGDVISPTVLTILFSQRAQLGTSPQIHNDNEEVYAYFSGVQHEMLITILRNMEKFPVVQGLQGSATLVGEAYVDGNYDLYVSFNGSTFTKLTSTKHTNLDDIPTGSTKVHGSQYLNSTDGLSTWHSAIAGDHITGGDDHTHLVDASPIKRIAHGDTLPTAEKIGQMYLKDDQLYMVYDSGLEFDEFFGIPAGSILPFPPASGCPSGWTEHGALNSDAYAKAVTGGTGTASGSNTHTHTISEIPQHLHSILEDTCTSDSSGAHNHAVYLQDSGTIRKAFALSVVAPVSAAELSGSHIHTGGTQAASTTSGLTSGSMVASFVSDSESSEPPYRTMKWCKKD